MILVQTKETNILYQLARVFWQLEDHSLSYFFQKYHLKIIQNIINYCLCFYVLHILLKMYLKK